MSKSNYLPRLLLCAIACFCSCVDRGHLNKHAIPQKEQKDTVLHADTHELGAVRAFSYGSRYTAGLETRHQTEKVQAVKRAYDSQLGVLEKGKNAGTAVESYLAYAGLKKGYPWCAAFVCWVLGRAGLPNPRSGWSPDLFPKEKVIWLKGKDIALPRPGSFKERPMGTADVFGIYFPEKRRIAHAGFIDARDDSWLITVEGNTNQGGSREGDGVYRKRRPVSSIYKVARYID